MSRIDTFQFSIDDYLVPALRIDPIRQYYLSDHPPIINDEFPIVNFESRHNQQNVKLKIIKPEIIKINGVRNEECSICLEPFVNFVEIIGYCTCCEHGIDLECFDKLNSDECPICRSKNMITAQLNKAQTKAQKNVQKSKIKKRRKNKKIYNH